MFSVSLSWWIDIWVICPWNKFEEKAQCESTIVVLNRFLYISILFILQMYSLFWQQKILWRSWQNFGTKWSFSLLYVRILAQIFKNSFGIYVWWNFLFYECSVQFEVLSSPTNSKWTTELTDIYDKYLEDWVGDYWLQPKYLPEGFKVINPKIRQSTIYYAGLLGRWDKSSTKRLMF